MATFNSIEEIIADLKQGKMVIIVDDEDRENEGDLLMAASQVRAEDVNFMASYGRGLICLTLSQQRCEQLQLPLMVGKNGAAHGTNFTLSIEAAKGVTTGISASDRAKTVQDAVAKEAKPEDIVQPGHIFPLRAQNGGVLTRAGHTEAGCDLARLAGFEPAALIVEILNDDGSMARRPDLEKFAQKHQLKMGTIAELIEYRLKNEHTIELLKECPINTEYGEFRLHAYKDILHDKVHLALVKGDICAETPVLVRVHMENTIRDLLPLSNVDSGWPISDILKRITQEGSGIVIILRAGDSDQNILNEIDRYDVLQESSKTELKSSYDLKTYGIGAQILKSIGAKKMRVMSAPKKLHSLSGFGLEVVEYVSGE